MGWNGSGRQNSAPVQPKPAPKKPSAMKGVVAGLVTVVALGAVFYFMFSGDEGKVEIKESKKGRIVDIGKVKPPTVSPGQGETNAAAATTAKAPAERVISSRKTSLGYTIEITEDANGHRTRHIREPKSMWKSSTDAVIASVLMTPKGQELPPLPPMDKYADAEFLAACKNPIEDSPDDTERQKIAKAIVRSAREEIKERIEAGEHFADILNDHRKLLNENGKIRSDAIRELAEIKKTKDPVDAEVYVTAVNQAFERMGIEPIGERAHASADPDAPKPTALEKTRARMRNFRQSRKESN